MFLVLESICAWITGYNNDILGTSPNYLESACHVGCVCVCVCVGGGGGMVDKFFIVDKTWFRVHYEVGYDNINIAI